MRSDVPVFDDRTPTWKDPGTRIDPARFAACLDRIFGDGPRLTTGADA